ncbi:MAG: hypothetical protein ACFFD2_29650, partial [Promethearchaeota archaeon]
MIYVKNQPFSQCMYLLINVSVPSIRDYDQINSIDEAAEVLNRSMEGGHGHHMYNITPETEFWGHCSNIQAWAENDYNTCILHRNIAFPLLKKLAEAGDIKAKRVYKDEIASRFSSGHSTVMLYLLNQGYLNALNKEEMSTLMEDLDLSVFRDQRIDMLFKIFQQFERYGYKNNKNLIKNQIKYRFEKGIARDINFLIRRRGHYYYRKFLNYFTSEELSELYNNIAIDRFVGQRIQESFPLLKYLTEMGNIEAAKILKEKIIASFQENRINDIRYIIQNRFLNRIELSHIEEFFNESTIKMILDPTKRESFSCLKHLPEIVKSSDTLFEFLKTTLSGKFFVYKTQAAVLLINQFFEQGHQIIEKIVTQYKQKIRLPFIEALVNKNCEKTDNLLKLIDWSRIWYADRFFLKFDDKRITAERAHTILLKNNFRVIQRRSSYSIYEFSSYSAFKDLSEKIDNLNQNPIEEFSTLERAMIRDARLFLPALPIFDIDYGPYKKFMICFHHTKYWKEIHYINEKHHHY